MFSILGPKNNTSGEIPTIRLNHCSLRRRERPPTSEDPIIAACPKLFKRLSLPLCLVAIHMYWNFYVELDTCLLTRGI